MSTSFSCSLFLFSIYRFLFFFQAEDGIRDRNVTGVQTCALPISGRRGRDLRRARALRQGQLPRRLELQPRASAEREEDLHEVLPCLLPRRPGPIQPRLPCSRRRTEAGLPALGGHGRTALLLPGLRVRHRQCSWAASGRLCRRPEGPRCPRSPPRRRLRPQRDDDGHGHRLAAQPRLHSLDHRLGAGARTADRAVRRCRDAVERRGDHRLDSRLGGGMSTTSARLLTWENGTDLVIEMPLALGVEDVWKALTDSASVGAWFAPFRLGEEPAEAEADGP